MVSSGDPTEGRTPTTEGDANSEAGPDRRTALKWMALAAAVPAVGSSCTPDDRPDDAAGALSGARSGAAGADSGASGAGSRVGNPRAAGTPWDPDLVAPRRHWDLILSPDEREGLASLCDVIIPADDVSPAASQVGAVDYIDEWVSAPYDGMRRDRVLIQGGLIWLDREAAQRFGEGLRFRQLGPSQQTAICDDICWIRRAASEHRTAARFFAKVRDLTATAFYTTSEGMADIGYMGNTALARWEAPPDEVLRHLGLV
jgi:hypothetical protein